VSNQMTPEDLAYVERVRASFARQQVMALIGADLRTVAPGATEIVLPCRPELSQQDGFVHAGIVTTIADSACGYAAFSLMPSGVGVLTVEFKVKMLAPRLALRLRLAG
jgi:uncharacterized protein (TIGR00369 family)